MKIVAINGSPRKNWNTDMLVKEAVKGAESEGAVVEKYDLYDLEKISGCVSCFGCKRGNHKGQCVINDDLKPILDSIRTADGLILGAPNYFGDLCAEFKLFYERLMFPHLTYRKDVKNNDTRRMPVLLIMTSNAPDTYYSDMLDRYEGMLEIFVGPTRVLVSGETMQVNDYSKFDWNVFDEEKRKARRETVFPQELKKAYEMGASLFVD